MAPKKSLKYFTAPLLGGLVDQLNWSRNFCGPQKGSEIFQEPQNRPPAPPGQV